MKKTVLFSLLSITALSVTSNVVASDVPALLKAAFPQSMFTTKCSSSNAKLDWNKIAKAETEIKSEENIGRKHALMQSIQQKITERVDPCNNSGNPKYSSALKAQCEVGSAKTQYKNYICGRGPAPQQGDFGGGQPQQVSFGGQNVGFAPQPQGGFGQQRQGGRQQGGFGQQQQQQDEGGRQQGGFGQQQQQQGGNMQAVDGRIQALEQQVNQLMEYLKKIHSFVQKLDNDVQQMQQSQGGGFGGQQHYGQQGGYNQEGYGQQGGGFGQQQDYSQQGGYNLQPLGSPNF